MKTFKVKIVLEVEVEVDARGRVDEELLKQTVYDTVEGMVADETLEYDVSADDDEEEEYD